MRIDVVRALDLIQQLDGLFGPALKCGDARLDDAFARAEVGVQSGDVDLGGNC